jgi:AcrR family transcriptional regulator
VTLPQRTATPRRNRPRPTGPERVTSLDTVLEVAGRMLDEQGLDALTMRRLAQELGVSSMTVYGYVASKDELLEAIAARVLGNLALGGDPSSPWDKRLAAVAIELRTSLREHPGVAEIVLSRPTPALDRFREMMLDILETAGFTDQDAGDLLVLTSCFALGYAHSELFRDSTDYEAEAERLRRLPAGEFPHLTAAAATYSRPLRDDSFEIGLRSLIRGFTEERLTPEPPPP